ncbi:vomeronasal type-2 receptor 26-like [Mantella aurantiaca]
MARKNYLTEKDLETIKTYCYTLNNGWQMIPNPPKVTVVTLGTDGPFPGFYRRLLAFIFAVDEINRSPDILPNVTLGYHMYDSCNNVNKAIESVLQILSGPGDLIPNFCLDSDKLAGVIFHPSAERSLHIVQILNLYGYTQIVCGPSYPVLTKENIYPSFFQTLPCDQTQSLAIVKLLIHFSWTWIGVIASVDDTGEKQSQELRKVADSYKICIEFSIRIPRDDKQNDYKMLVKEAEGLRNSTSRIIVFCGSISLTTIRFLTMVQSVFHEKTLIIPAGSFVQETIPIKKIRTLNGCLIFSPTNKQIPPLRNLLEDISIAKRPDDILLKQIAGIYLKCKTSNQEFNRFLEFHNIKLHTFCPEPALALIKSHSLIVSTIKVANTLLESFNLSGMLSPMLPILGSSFLSLALDYPQFVVLVNVDKGSCQKCPEDQWPNDYDQCVPKPVEYLSYTNTPVTLAIFVITGLFFAITLVISLIFFMYRGTPVIRANNRDLSLVLLVSIMLSFLSVFLFLGRPVHITCMLRHTVYGVLFSVAVSSILAKTVIVYMSFKATKPGNAWKKFIGVKIPMCLVLICSFFQIVTSIIWLSVSPPFPEANTDLYLDRIIIQCNEGSILAFAILLGYLGLLAAVSFIVAFLARNLPDGFNEAKYITFSMLVFCSVWITFIPAYLSVTGMNTILVEIFSIISSSAGILGCIFFPKCYIVLVRPDLNSKSIILKQMCHR